MPHWHQFHSVPTTFGISTVFSLVPAADPLLMIIDRCILFNSLTICRSGSWLMICPFLRYQRMRFQPV